MSTPVVSSRFAICSLVCIGLMWVFPFLHKTHQYPIPTFYQEWWTVFFALLAAMLLLGRVYWQVPTLPRVVILPLAFLVVLLLQYGLSKIVYYQHAILWALYFLLMAMLMILGAQLRQRLGLLRVATVLAFFLLLGGVLSSVAALQQHFLFEFPLKHWVVVKLGAAVYGNLGQTNHFANYVSLGLVSLGLLYQLRRLPGWLVMILLVPLLLTLALSASRSVFLYLAFFLMFSGWQYRANRVFKRLFVYCASLLVLFVLLQWVVAQPWLAGATPQGAISASERLVEGLHSENLRGYLWREAWWMFSQSPWLGVGIGQFSWQHFLLLPELKATYIQGPHHNAHNLPLQFAAETGLCGLLILVSATLIWMRGQWTATAALNDSTEQAARWWALALLGVLLIHSQFELPLWYAYFLGIFAVLLGLLDSTCYPLRSRGLGRFSMSCLWLIGVLVLVQVRSDYMQLEPLFSATVRQQLEAGEAVQETTEATLDRIKASPILAPYAEGFISITLTADPFYLEQKLALNQRVMQHVPVGNTAYRQILLLAQAGQLAEAQHLVAPALWSYPADFAGFKQQLDYWVVKDPERFSALREFALQYEQEYLRTISD